MQSSILREVVGGTPTTAVWSLYAPLWLKYRHDHPAIKLFAKVREISSLHCEMTRCYRAISLLFLNLQYAKR